MDYYRDLLLIVIFHIALEVKIGLRYSLFIVYSFVNILEIILK